MAWEKRQRGGRYYTRSRRVEGRVVREYLGTGPFAEAFAHQDAEARERQNERRVTEQSAHEEDAALVALLERLSMGTDALVAATLVLAGVSPAPPGRVAA